jgi:hypothetical protein
VADGSALPQVSRPCAICDDLRGTIQGLERELYPHFEDDGLLGRVWAFCHQMLVHLEAGRASVSPTSEPRDDTDLLWRIWEIATYCRDKTESCKAIAEMVEKAWEPSGRAALRSGVPPDGAPEDPRFEAIWQRIKGWDISTGEMENESPEHRLYSDATGNHVRAILDALDAVSEPGVSRGTSGASA